MAQWSKSDIIKQAFSEIGKGAYDFDLQPEDMQTALRKLDAMLAGWGPLGVRIGYTGGNGKGDLGADSTVPDWAYEALYLNLALRLCPDYGKTPSPLTVMGATSALSALRGNVLKVAPRSISGYAGSGNGRISFIPQDGGSLAAGQDSEFDIGGGQ